MNIFTQNQNLYPTPPEVIDMMLMDETVTGKTILEPSAGTGNIVTRLAQLGAAQVLACETDANLRAILRTKPCEIIAEDFLTVTAEQVSHVDMIIMNPPFEHDMEHIIHAYDIAPAGCTVIALCNASHIVAGGWSQTQRQAAFLEIIENHGWSENIGNAFRGAERGTDCPIGLVKLYKSGSGASEFDGFVFDGAPDSPSGGGAEGLMTYDFIRDIVNRYCAAVSAFDEVKAKAEEINRLAQFPDAGPYNDPPIKFLAVRTGSDRVVEAVSHDRYRKELQKYYWKVIFEKMNLNKYATQKLREQINKFVERQRNMPFTMKNIYHVIDIIFQTNGQRMETALLDAFDTICGFSAENSTAGEKWKTNSDYMVNRRFIVPYVTDGYGWDGRPWPKVRIHHNGTRNQIDDITRALCYFTGRDFYSVGTLYERLEEKEEEWGKWFEWGFFRCKGYLKGTMHFEFLDEDTWAEFNRKVASLRGWNLPRTTKKEKRKSA